jgi:hypothetical protein
MTYGRIESTMNPNDSNLAGFEDGTNGISSSDQERTCADRFTERIRAFEQGCRSGSAGSTNFLRVAGADFLRMARRLERVVVGELNEPLENPSEHRTSSLRYYTRTLQVLREVLQASAELEKELPR